MNHQSAKIYNHGQIFQAIYYRLRFFISVWDNLIKKQAHFGGFTKIIKQTSLAEDNKSFQRKTLAFLV